MIYTFITLTFLLGPFFIVANIIDYFDPEFDENKNCKHEQLMRQLEVDQSRCSRFSRGSDAVQWEECKKVLSKKLAESCPNTKIERVSKH